jgi:hypothetical protein
VTRALCHALQVPRCLCFIFAKIRELRARNCEVIIKVSFIEIYNETVMDLLSHNPRLMNLREDALNDRVFVEGVLEAKVWHPTAIRVDLRALMCPHHHSRSKPQGSSW